MEILSSYVIYLAIIRLAIIISGIISIVLGYQLFVKGVFPGASAKSSPDGQNIDAEIAGSRFSLQNAAPGTCFAIFGVVIISLMYAGGGPELSLEMLEKNNMKANLRGKNFEERNIQAYCEQAVKYLKQGDHTKANQYVTMGLDEIAPQMNDFAWVLLKTAPEKPQAKLLAELTTITAPQNPNFLHTLAAIQYANGEKQEAIKTLTKASQIDSAYGEQLQIWRKQIPEN
ncbi:MAG: hypothetical protein MI892_26100 [Desulfobacterales bacterium]|nr:hypothetical protein [Desulfobacterales bacterium]